MAAMGAVSLQEAIASLYDIAIAQGKSTSTSRLKRLADYCRQGLAAQGLEGAETEAEIPGGGRQKEWDVAWKYQGKYRLAISLKSILKNPGGTVPNRIDDLIGETANAQMYSPEIVVGYLMIFDVSGDSAVTKHGVTWCELLEQRLGNLSGRRAPYWSIGTIEGFAVLRVNFSSGPIVLGDESVILKLLGDLAAEVRRRNPAIT